MKKITTIIVFSILIFSFILTVNAKSPVDDNLHNIDYYHMFEENGSVLLLIDINTGNIEQANKAASEFYGYPVDQLTEMKIFDISLSNLETIKKRMQKSVRNHKNHYQDEQRLENGKIKTVEVYSCPHSVGNKTLIFTNIFDITDKIHLEKRDKMLNRALYIVLSAIIIIIGIATTILIYNFRKLKKQTRELDNFNELRRTFINAFDQLIYLKDENSKYIFANKAVQQLYQKKESEIIGKKDFELIDGDLAEKLKETDQNVHKTKSVSIQNISYNNKIYKTTMFPVKLNNGSYGVGAYIEDRTDSYNYRRKEEKRLLRNQILVEVLTKQFKTTQEQLDYVLNESLKLTESNFGYIYLYDESNQEFTLISWSENVMEECKVVNEKIKYQLSKTGIWGEVVRQRKPIIVNDFQMPNSMKKGYPKGHVEITKFMSVPVVIDDKIVAVVGFANKLEDYDYNDVYQVLALMNGVWYAKERRETLIKLAVERNRFLQTLISIGDGVLVVDMYGKVTIINKVAEKLTGWSADEAIGRHYKQVFALAHEDEKLSIQDPIEGVFKTDNVQELGNHAILTDKCGNKYYIEDSAAPIKDDRGITTGVVLVFRDVTEKKSQRKRIEYLSFHDSLTGLYNRMFYEEELKRLDNNRNLPLSIIVGDMNGLKLANDIFGHTAGDELLKKIAETLKTVCRTGDIIARVGGDEFYIILPKTKEYDAINIITRIKNQFSTKSVKAIKGSISMGCAAKTNENENIADIVSEAEKRMYAEKSLDRRKIKSSAIKAIIDELHDNFPEEKEHSNNVRDVCHIIGKAMNLSDIEIERLKEAGYLHDIGKIVLDEKLISKNQQLSVEEKYEMNQHPVAGFRILNSFDDTIDLAESVLAHHEKWDGTGYPKGVKGEQIPLTARIIAAAEYYDAITNRPYNKALQKEEIITELKNQAGKRLDPHIIDLFIKILLEGSLE